MRGRVLVIAGSDSGGGAGIQADIKTATALGAYAATAITALTVQDTLGVHAVMQVPPDFVRAQIRAVLGDIGADAIKIGMLGDAATVAAVAEAIAEHAAGIPLVLDPVMVAKGGAALLDPDAVAALQRLLVPRATLLTPNTPEASVLAGVPVPDLAAARQAARALLRLGVAAVLLKGGHLPGDTVTDLLATAHETIEYAAPRIPGRSTHGTGCTLSTAIAVRLAQGAGLTQAVAQARAYLLAAIAAAPGLGAGHGPLDHTVTVTASGIANVMGV
jgi:hydroxymethylpyrimidine/phosphomethylpyrimidine kinase